MVPGFTFLFRHCEGILNCNPVHPTELTVHFLAWVSATSSPQELAAQQGIIYPLRTGLKSESLRLQDRSTAFSLRAAPLSPYLHTTKCCWDVSAHPITASKHPVQTSGTSQQFLADNGSSPLLFCAAERWPASESLSQASAARTASCDPAKQHIQGAGSCVSSEQQWPTAHFDREQQIQVLHDRDSIGPCRLKGTHCC